MPSATEMLIIRVKHLYVNTYFSDLKVRPGQYQFLDRDGGRTSCQSDYFQSWFKNQEYRMGLLISKYV